MRSYVLSLILLIMSAPEISFGIQCNELFKLKVETRPEDKIVSDALFMLDKLFEHKLVKKKYYEHAKKDLEGTKSEIREHSSHEAFSKLLGEWGSFLSRGRRAFVEYEAMSPAEQKVWRKKINLVGRFSVGQFVTFVEADKPKTDQKHLARLYSSQLSMLSNLNSLPEDLKLSLLVFELEKQVKRFFSIFEIERCKF